MFKYRHNIIDAANPSNDPLIPTTDQQPSLIIRLPNQKNSLSPLKHNQANKENARPASHKNNAVEPNKVTWHRPGQGKNMKSDRLQRHCNWEEGTRKSRNLREFISEGNEELPAYMGCSTHAHSRAEYKYVENGNQGEALYYCGVCASRLISQGFLLLKMDSRPSRKPLVQSRLRKTRNEISKYLNEAGWLNQEVSSIKEKYEGLYAEVSWPVVPTVEQSEQLQIELVQKFYEKIIAIVQEYKIKHLRQLRDDSKIGNFQSSQVQQIREAEIKQKLEYNLTQLADLHEGLHLRNFREALESLPSFEIEDRLYGYQDKLAQLEQELASLQQQSAMLSAERAQHAREQQQRRQADRNERKLTVRQIQQAIDNIEKQIKQVYGGEAKQVNGKKSNSLHKFISEYGKENGRKTMEKPKNYEAKPKFSLIQQFLQNEGTESEPQFRRI